MKLLDGRRRMLGSADPATLTAIDMLASNHDSQGNLEEAERLFVEALNGRRRALGKDDTDTAATLDRLGWIRARSDKFAEAEPLLRECLEIREKTTPDDWQRFHTASLLGACLAGEKKFVEAEPILISSYKALTDREKLVPPFQKKVISAAGARIVLFYERSGEKSKADEWRKKILPSSPAVPSKP